MFPLLTKYFDAINDITLSSLEATPFPNNLNDFPKINLQARNYWATGMSTSKGASPAKPPLEVVSWSLLATIALHIPTPHLPNGKVTTFFFLVSINLIPQRRILSSICLSLRAGDHWWHLPPVFFYWALWVLTSQMQPCSWCLTQKASMSHSWSALPPLAPQTLGRA